MKHRNYILIITFCFILPSITSFGQSKNPINTGFVFIDGEYLSAPYNINTDGKSIFINEKQICSTFETLVNISTNNEHPGYPNCLTKFSSIEEINNCFLLGENISYVKAASLYYIDNYDYEIANDSIIEYYKNLPNIENITQKNGPFYNVNLYDGRILTMYFSVDRLRQLYPKNTKSGKIEGVNIANLIENHISNIRALLENNELLFFFSDENYNNFLVSNPNNIGAINNIIKSNYSQEVKIDSLTEILHNKILIEKLINNKSLDLKQMESLITNSFIQDSNKVIRQDKLVKNTSEGTIAYSPERNKIKAFCPAIYETNTFGMFLTQEFENVKTKIVNCGFNNPILYVDYTANDTVFACDYYYIKHMADNAGFIYIAAHGGAEGMLLTRGTTEGAIITWITDMDDLLKINIANVPDAYKPTEWTAECYEAYASSEWASENWGTKLVENKTITILSICNGFDNGWVNACAGGACFGYQGETNFTSASRHNDSLLNNMNGSSGAGQFRLASQAYARVKLSNPTSNFKYSGNDEVTLCPGIVSKLPDNLSIVNSSGNGYIALDTWCNSDIDLNINSYLSPVSFTSQGNIVISDLAWDNPVGGKSNKINFSWLNSSSQNSGIVTVHINAEKFQSTPAIFNEYHTLNATVEPPSYSFQVNPYNESLPIISGKVYDNLTSNHVTSGTVKDTDNPENLVAINSQGEYSISVNQGWSGSLTASAPGYAPKTQPFNSVLGNTGYNFYLKEMPDLYISTTNENPNQCPFPAVKYKVENGSVYWDYTWYLNDVQINPDQDGKIFTTINDFINGNNVVKVKIIIGSLIVNKFINVSVTVPCPETNNQSSILIDCSLVNIGTTIHFYETSVFTDTWKEFRKRNWTLADGDTEEHIAVKKAFNEVDPYDISYVFNTTGHKIIKLEYWGKQFWFSLNYNQLLFTEWGGVNVINCDLTSVLFTHPLFSSGIFLGAVYDNWEYNNNTGPLYIYGGSFLFNGTANNHLNRDLPIIISACNEITITGDVEFVANGENELILEIQKPCNYETNSDKTILYPDNDTTVNSFFNKSSCYPNPFRENINLYFEITSDKVLYIEFLDMLGNVFFKNSENYATGSHLLNISTTNLPPAVYVIRIFNEDTFETFKIVKQ